jgi:hypothetical protein
MGVEGKAESSTGMPYLRSSRVGGQGKAPVSSGASGLRRP